MKGIINMSSHVITLFAVCMIVISSTPGQCQTANDTPLTVNSGISLVRNFAGDQELPVRIVSDPALLSVPDPTDLHTFEAGRFQYKINTVIGNLFVCSDMTPCVPQ
jgi:hypothetical protein